ncbi:hypothetical protein OG379_18065 [Streptomyces sp. NBC_01166]|uniref:hypothetical protein n=1 Tax=Streptomyces sp. NBC_01166 TaxID=2903755 RepID=UPI0038647F70|nr:hypothetical protein OG379_18065 [Streptomyces sp. NBC_01166]
MDRFPRSVALAAAGLVVVLALTACGSDDSDGDKAPDTGSSSEQATSPGAGSEEGASGGADAAALEGTWTGTADGGPVTLSVTSGKVALSAGRHVCQGEVKDMGEVMLALKCLDGNTDRTMGSVESDDGKKLVISWGAGTEDTLSRTDLSELPTGLPEVPAP